MSIIRRALRVKLMGWAVVLGRDINYGRHDGVERLPNIALIYLSAFINDKLTVDCASRRPRTLRMRMEVRFDVGQ